VGDPFHGLACLQITHGCQAWFSWAPLGRRSEIRLDRILRGLANPETRWREAKPKEQEKTMPPLARRNLFHDKIRLAVTLTGITFAVLLVVVELGLFLGFSTTTSSLIDRSRADFWIASRNVPYIEQGAPFSERKLYQVRATPGVASAEKYIVRFAGWKHHDGGQETVQVVGFNVGESSQRVSGGRAEESGQLMGGPWNITSGSVADLNAPNAVMVDDLYWKKLGITRVGEVFEINGYRARVVGTTHGIRSFTTSPYVFTTFKNAQNFGLLREDQTVFILVRAATGTDLKELQRDIESHVSDVDVLTTSQFSHMTRSYWMFTTGAGMAVLLAALLGLIVGIVVVTQTIYATTMDHLREYGTLKAIGAPNSYIYRVILQQAAMSAVMGYALGIGVSLFLVRSSAQGGIAILLPWSMAALIFALTLLMCGIAAAVSINKVTTLDPAMVFRN
jgi:putative ABC transport system permease protein